MKGRKEKEKWKENMERKKNEIENEIRVNGYGDDKKMGGKGNGKWGGVYINE